MSDIKLCKDCKHFRRAHELDWQNEHLREKYATCFLTAKVNEYDGDRCWDRRSGIHLFGCGQTAKQWESK